MPDLTESRALTLDELEALYRQTGRPSPQRIHPAPDAEVILVTAKQMRRLRAEGEAGMQRRDAAMRLSFRALALAVQRDDPHTHEYLKTAFRCVEDAVQGGASFGDLGRAFADEPQLARATGSLGPLYMAVQLALGRAVRAPVEHTEVARDVLHNLRAHGRMHCIEVAPETAPETTP
ncbi:MAG: hypothetical protein OXC08_20760 [Thiotrichales bacterium]|nr:hypothetical protein [Thiotrichales bacterium]